jgi:Phosphotransferase enzyme family
VEFDHGVLESVVGRVLEAEQVALGEWSAEQLLAGDGQGVGVFRLKGSARLGDETHAWSVILKVLPEGGSAPLTAWSLPMREPLAYESGLLERLPSSLRAPRCLRCDLQGGRHHVWLEDLGSDDAPWSLSDYAHAARQLGRFNGAYLEERPVPSVEWLSRDWLRSWLAEGAAAMNDLPRHRAHRLVRLVYPPSHYTELTRVWTHRESLLLALDRLPQVLCHNDAFRRNLFLRSGQLFAVDWAFLGIGPLGSELAPLVSASATFLGVGRAQWEELERTAMAAYGQGLADAGWRGPPELARFGFAASSALRYWPGVVRLVISTLLDEAAHSRVETMLGIPFPEIVDLWADFAAWQAQLAAEAMTTVPHAP